MSVGTITVQSIAITYESHDGKVSKVLQTDASSFILASDSDDRDFVSDSTLTAKAVELLELHTDRIGHGLERIKRKDFPASLWKDNK